MSSAKWRPFCLGLNVITCHLFQNLISMRQCLSANLPTKPTSWHLSGLCDSESKAKKKSGNFLIVLMPFISDLTHCGQSTPQAFINQDQHLMWWLGTWQHPAITSIVYTSSVRSFSSHRLYAPYCDCAACKGIDDVMAWCLTAPSHPPQCLYFVNKIHSSHWLYGPYWECDACKGNFLSSDSLAKSVF